MYYVYTTVTTISNFTITTILFIDTMETWTLFIGES